MGMVLIPVSCTMPRTLKKKKKKLEKSNGLLSKEHSSHIERALTVEERGTILKSKRIAAAIDGKPRNI